MSQVKKLIFLDPDQRFDDPIDALLGRLNTNEVSDADLVCRIHRNSENGNIAVLPETAKSESDWEARSILMHSQQQPLSPLAAKPGEIWGGAKITRGD